MSPGAPAPEWRLRWEVFRSPAARESRGGPSCPPRAWRVGASFCPHRRGVGERPRLPGHGSSLLVFCHCWCPQVAGFRARDPYRLCRLRSRCRHRAGRATMLRPGLCLPVLAQALLWPLSPVSGNVRRGREAPTWDSAAAVRDHYTPLAPRTGTLDFPEILCPMG